MWKFGLSVGLLVCGVAGCGDDSTSTPTSDGGVGSDEPTFYDSAADPTMSEATAEDSGNSLAHTETGSLATTSSTDGTASSAEPVTSDTTTSHQLDSGATSDDAASTHPSTEVDAYATSEPNVTSSPNSLDAPDAGVDSGGTDAGDTDTDSWSTDVDGGLGSDSWGTGSESGGTGSDAATDVDGGVSDAVEARAGFVDIEGVNYVYAGSQRQTSSTRLFYAFTPADELPEEAPVFVFFNGGPGSATSSALMSYGTGNYSLPADLSGPNLEPNPWSWAQMGNLLYFDTRQAGFSYSTLEDPSDADARALGGSEHNFNLYVDAADSVRLVLRVLSQQPRLRDNPIILVGESYGGTRATMMLRSLLNPEWLSPPTIYEDPALKAEIEQFFELNLQDQTATIAEQAKRQLPAQVLIQPFFAGNQFDDQDAIRCLPGTPASEVASNMGVSCPELYLFADAYKIDGPPTWISSLLELAQQTLMHATKLPLLLGVELDDIRGLAAAERTTAYRDPTVGWYAPDPQFVEQLGELQAWDAYHLTSAGSADWSQTIYTDPNPCYVFPWVAQQVDTFMTNAKWDIVVLTPALPKTLYDCSQLASEPFVDSIEFPAEQGLAMGESGQMVLRLNESAPEGESETSVEIRGYDAGHLVTVTHAEELFTDVQAFLVERGVL